LSLGREVGEMTIEKIFADAKMTITKKGKKENGKHRTQESGQTIG
jgi:hypothetical protein